MKNRIYMDNASLTPISAEAKRETENAWKEFGNAGSIHKEGARAKKRLDEARRTCALVLNCKPEEIVFTSGGTESNNLAIIGCVNALLKQKIRYDEMHFVTSVIEHSSVLKIMRELESRGSNVTYLKVDSKGLINLFEFEKSLNPRTVLVSIMYANNETGVIEPVRRIARIIGKVNSTKNKPIIFHVDASQAPLCLDVNRNTLGADIITLDSQKIYGPLGSGLLYVARSVRLEPLMFGGGQERGLRPGTENVPAISGFAKALQSASKNREKEVLRLLELKNLFTKTILKKIPSVIVNASDDECLPNIINISIPGLDAEFAVLKLDAAGIACSTRSACLDDEKGSYVVLAMGGSERAKSSIRFSFGKDTKKNEILIVANALERICRSSSQKN